MSNYLTSDGLKKIFSTSGGPLRPEARGICHICHMVNPALGITWHNVCSEWVKIYHAIQIKLSHSRVTNISKSFTTRRRRKPDGIDMERNYVTVILCRL